LTNGLRANRARVGEIDFEGTRRAAEQEAYRRDASFDALAGLDLEKEVERARAWAVATYAIVYQGVWYERESPTWWGIEHGDDDDLEWPLRQTELIESLPNDEIVTAVHCHC